MIVGSAPLRVSLLGGGTDIPSYFNHATGAVLGGSIDKRVFVCVLDMVDSAKFPFRFTYRQVDNATEKNEIQHPVWRELLIRNQEVLNLNAATFSDVPGSSGLGSSSAFTVAGIAALKMHQGFAVDPDEISAEAIRIEREILGEPGGWQDQIHASYGGFRLYRFEKGQVVVGEQLLDDSEMELLNKSCFLVKVGEERDSKEFHSPINEKLKERHFLTLETQGKLAIQGGEILGKQGSWEGKFQAISDLVAQNWTLKKSVKDRSNSEIDDLVNFGLKNGSISSKLCGAGGSGYVLFLGFPDGILNLKTKMRERSKLEFDFNTRGVEAIEI